MSTQKKDVITLKLWLSISKKPVVVIQGSKSFVEQFKKDLKDESIEFVDLDGFIFAKKDFSYATID